jgi:hypothetical protein
MAGIWTHKAHINQSWRTRDLDIAEARFDCIGPNTLENTTSHFFVFIYDCHGLELCNTVILNFAKDA